MRLKILVPVCAAALLLAAFIPSRKVKPIESIPPPGVQQIDQQLFMDCTEATNFYWLEYLHWTAKVYGKSSREYIAILPDTSLWASESEALKPFEKTYLRHPAYHDYPVVGLTYAQMAGYCRWRSDRVLEHMLVRTGRIPFDANPTQQTFFTTEKYLAGQYLGYAKDPAIQAVPEYSLPTLAEWKKAEAYSAAVYEKLSDRRRKKGPDAYYATLSDKVLPVNPPGKYSIPGALYNLHRNVSEQLADSLLSAGAGWKAHSTLAEGETNQFDAQASVTKGFRCAFRWKPVQ